MERIVTNWCRSRKKGIITVMMFSLFILFVQRNLLNTSMFQSRTTILQPVFRDAVILSKRRISSDLSTKITASHNHSELEEHRRKYISRTGVLASLKPGMRGFVNVHLWLNLCGTNILSLKLFPLFPNVPSIRLLLSSLDIVNLSASYGKRVFGYLAVPTSTKYSFRLKYSGIAEFWLSTNDKPRDSRCLLCLKEGNVARTAQIYLRHSKLYYFEILHKHEGLQKLDHLSLQWKINDSEYTTVSTNHLQSYQDDREIFQDVVNTDSFPRPGLEMHGKNEAMKTGKYSQSMPREEIYKLPFITQDLIKDLFPRCKYKPDYLVTYKLQRYTSLWEAVYPSIFPVDHTNHTDTRGVVSFGNDILEEKAAMRVVKMIMKQLKNKGLRQFKLENVLNVEEKRGRYLVELELLNQNTKKSVRFSEYLYLPKDSKYPCYPEGFNWNKTSMVNFVVTAGRNQGRWVYHLIKNMEKIYNETKDKNFNVIINDFLCPDADLKHALETSSLPNYLYLTNPGNFHKTLGLQQAAGAVTDGIIAILDLHLQIPSYYVDDMRKHTLPGVQVYSPLLQRYECGTNSAVDMGSYWEFHGYGLVGIYKNDWDKFGGMNVEEYRHKWGGEDVEMNDRILMAGFEGYRKKVKGLGHYFHSKSGMWNN